MVSLKSFKRFVIWFTVRLEGATTWWNYQTIVIHIFPCLQFFYVSASATFSIHAVQNSSPFPDPTSSISTCLWYFCVTVSWSLGANKNSYSSLRTAIYISTELCYLHLNRVRQWWRKLFSNLSWGLNQWERPVQIFPAGVWTNETTAALDNNFIVYLCSLIYIYIYIWDHIWQWCRWIILVWGGGQLAHYHYTHNKSRIW